MDESSLKTPLYEEHLALGARMTPFAGHEMPLQYAGIIDEHRAVRTRAGAFDVCHMGEIRVHGFGAFEHLQSALTNDLGRIAEVGAAQYTLLCDEDGGIVDDIIVYHSGDLEYLLVTNASNRTAVLDAVRRDAPPGLEVQDESERTGLIALQGPEAIRVMRQLVSDSAWEPPPRFHIAEARILDTPVLVARTGYTGEDGVEVFCAAMHAVGVWRAFMSAPEVQPCGIGARDTLRLEMGYPLHGSDIDSGVDPLSARLGWAVSFDKGPFTGRDALLRIREAGPRLRMAGLRVDGLIPRRGSAILHGGAEVAKVASGSFSPTLSCGIALAYLPAALADPGTFVDVVARSRNARAEVVRPPFVTNTSLQRTK